MQTWLRESYDQLSDEKMRQLSLRIDDIDGRTAIEGLQHLNNLMKVFNGTCEISLIPFRHEMKSAQLKKLNEFSNLQISIHGHSHIKRTKFSEFRALNLTQQEKLIRESIEKISSLDNYCGKFVPPWNDFDAATLAVLSSLGITTLGTSYKQARHTHKDVALEPISLDIKEFLSLLKRSAFIQKDWNANVMAHTYDFVDFGDGGFISLDEFFMLVRENNISITTHINYSGSFLLEKWRVLRPLRKILNRRILPASWLIEICD